MALASPSSGAGSLTTPRPLAAGKRRATGLPGPGSLVSTSVGSSSDSVSREEQNAGELMTIQRLQCFKTKRCKFWQEGRCTRGERCTYAHTEVELRVPPDLTKTKICTRWKRGTCDKSPQDCAYAHGSDDLRDASQTPAPRKLSDTESTASASISLGNTPVKQTPRWSEDRSLVSSPAAPKIAPAFRFDLLHMSHIAQVMTDIYID